MDTQKIVDEVTPIIRDFLSAHAPRLARLVNPLVPLLVAVVVKALVVSITTHPEVKAIAAKLSDDSVGMTA